MSEFYLGQITMFAGNFAPRAFALCNGQLLPVNQNSALFALLGTAYGGNGIQNFALPNLQSRLAIHVGHGTGLSNYALGQSGGTPTVTIDATTMPSHMHALTATTGPANTGTVGNGVVPATGVFNNNPADFYAAPAPNSPPPMPVAFNPGACLPAGGSQPHSNLMPSLCITFIIALQGIFPSRS
jgi:microcystin-dependent protein